MTCKLPISVFQHNTITFIKADVHDGNILPYVSEKRPELRLKFSNYRKILPSPPTCLDSHKVQNKDSWMEIKGA